MALAKTKANNSKELSAEKIEAYKKVKDYSLICEANIVSIMFKCPDRIYDSELKLEDFNNNVWKVYWQIAHDIIIVEKKSVLDDITVNLYLEKHDKLKEKFNEYGGYQTIASAKEYIKEENLDGYVAELKKWNSVLKLLKHNFPIEDRLSEFADLTSEQIYNIFEAHLNHIFVNCDTEVKSHNMMDGIYDLIESMDKGEGSGLPYNNSPLLNKEVGGSHLGNLSLLGASSGTGKTTASILLNIPSIIKYNEKMVIMINEESVEKFKKEFIIYVANNVFNEELNKYRLRDGKFTESEMTLLKKCADWIEAQKENRNITIIPLKKYKVSTVKKIINKYSSLGVKYFILDTFKVSTDIDNEQIWASMSRDATELYDCIKKEGKNVSLLMTYQLSKSSIKQRYFTNENIGQSKNIVDCAGTNIMIRKLLDDEFPGEKRELKVYRLEGKYGRTKIPMTIDKDKQYIIVFVTKNRYGSTNQYQIVVEFDMGRNLYKEIGITNVPLDF